MVHFKWANHLKWAFFYHYLGNTSHLPSLPERIITRILLENNLYRTLYIRPALAFYGKTVIIISASCLYFYFFITKPITKITRTMKSFLGDDIIQLILNCLHLSSLLINVCIHLFRIRKAHTNIISFYGWIYVALIWQRGCSRSLKWKKMAMVS